MRALLFTTVCSLSLMASTGFAVIISKDIPQAPKAHTLAADMASDDNSAMARLAKPYGTWGFDMSGMNTKVKPGDDFATYATGIAVDTIKIPSDQPGYGSFARLSDLSELREKQLIRALAADKKATGDDLKIGDLYRSAMDVMPLMPSLCNRL